MRKILTLGFIVLNSGGIQGTEEPSKGHGKPTHDILLIFLYGAASGAGVLILIILLLSTVSCCLKKQRKKKSQFEMSETSQASTQETENAGRPTGIEGDYIRTPCNLPDETQNESRHEVAVYDYPYTHEGGSGQTLIPPPYLADITRGNDAEELEDAAHAPFGRGHQDLKKPSKQKHPLYGSSKNEGKIYMHLIPETRQGHETSNSAKKSPKRSRQKEKETCATKGSSAISRETNKPTSTRTEVRPSSADYVNGHLAKLYCNVR